jgi:ribosomal protein S18 acetylase RimI-like enzyme
MEQDKYKIRIMTRSELDIAVKWAADEGWNPSLHDAESFWTADPSGFLIGLLYDEPIATISAVKYGTSFGFIGFYIVKPEYRGKGYGIKIWNAAMESLAGRNIGLDGVVAQQDNYKKSGFALAYSNVRYEGIKKNVAPVFAKNESIVDVSAVPFEDIENYDRKFFPENRTAFLKSWLYAEDRKAIAMMQNNEIVGYGVLRQCLSGYKIGPLFADTPEIAEALLVELVAALAENEVFYLDIPEHNTSAISLAGKFKMQVVFGTARMYTMKFPDLPIGKIFGVTSFELG